MANIPMINLPQIRPVSESIGRAAQTNLTLSQEDALRQDTALKGAANLPGAQADSIRQQTGQRRQQQLQDYQVQQQEYEAKKAVYYGQQAGAAAIAPLASRPGLYTNLYKKAQAGGEDVSMLPNPPKNLEEYKDAHQKTLNYFAQLGIEPAKQLEMAQKQREEQNKQRVNPGGATGELIDRYMKDTGANFSDSMAAVQGLARQGLQYDEQGNVINRAGFIQSQKDLESAKAEGKTEGKLTAETLDVYTSQLSKVPELNKTVEELGKLSDIATYTKAGLSRDAFLRQVDRKMSEGGIARAKYIAMVDNQILPLLKDTFGASFTVEEGKSLKATLGDPNATPGEKKAKLKAFIDQKITTLESTGRKLGYKKEETKNSTDNNDPLGIR